MIRAALVLTLMLCLGCASPHVAREEEASVGRYLSCVYNAIPGVCENAAMGTTIEELAITSCEECEDSYLLSSAAIIRDLPESEKEFLMNQARTDREVKAMSCDFLVKAFKEGGQRGLDEAYTQAMAGIPKQ